jgi:hypothetical protein
MKSVFGTLMSLALGRPLLYQGYVMPEYNEKFEPLQISVSAGWILLFVSIFVLALVYVLLRTDARFRKSKRENH